MPKPHKKKKKRIYTEEEQADAKQNLRQSLKAFNFRLALLMLGIFVVLTPVYYILIAQCVFWASPVLYTATAVLFMTFFFVNRGFSRETIRREYLPSDWTAEQKDAFLAEDAKRKAFAKKLMVPMVPMLFLVGIDIILVVLVPLLKS